MSHTAVQQVMSVHYTGPVNDFGPCRLHLWSHMYVKRYIYIKVSLISLLSIWSDFKIQSYQCLWYQQSFSSTWEPECFVYIALCCQGVALSKQASHCTLYPPYWQLAVWLDWPTCLNQLHDFVWSSETPQSASSNAPKSDFQYRQQHSFCIVFPLEGAALKRM